MNTVETPKISGILRDPSPEQIIAAIEENMFACNTAGARWPRVELLDSAEIHWSLTDIPHIVFNSVMRARLTSDRVSGMIRSLIAMGQARNVPILWCTGPQTCPVDLPEHLIVHGFASEGDAAGMAIDLTHLRESAPPPPGLSVQLVEDARSLRVWCRVCFEGFEASHFVAEAFYEFMSYMDPAAFCPYLGVYNGQPVATSLLVFAAGVAGLYNVATLPAARRMGIGTALALAPLRDACALGYELGILHASPMGASVYHRLGFREYCRIGQYVRSPPVGERESERHD